MTAFLLCVSCPRPIGGSEPARRFHESDCNRFLNGSCRCDGWVCLGCCPEKECTPLAAACALAREDVHARAAAAEAAHEATG